MKLLKTIGLLTCLALACSVPGWAKTAGKKPTAKVSAKKPQSKAKKAKGKSKKGAWKARGQQSIASERTLQIQEALVNAGYLTSEPSGRMDAATKLALMRLQKENGWQSKVVPDSRALIKLGLGPDHSNLLNPDTAMLPSVSSTAAVQTATPQ